MTVVKLFLMLVFIAALGASLLPHRWYRRVLDDANQTRARACCLIGFAALSAGLLANYFLVLVAQRLAWAGAAGATWIVVRAVQGWVAARKAPARATKAAPVPVVHRSAVSALQGTVDVAGWLLAGGLLCGLGIWTLAQPVAEWDPRSIWFFHAKIIFFSGGLLADSGWALKLLAFSQPDYPKLFPVLAAQAASLFGYWNEYVPKLSLLVLQAAALGGVLALARSRLEAVLLVCGVVVFNAAAFTTGYLDVFLAVFATCAIGMLARAAAGEHEALWLPGLLACALLPALKNEGILLALITLAVTLAVAPKHEGRAFFNWRAAMLVVVAAAAFLPAVLWMVLRSRWNIHALEAFGPDFWTRVGGRLAGGDLVSIVQELAKQGKVLSSGFLVALTALYLRRRFPLPALACLAVASVYFAGLVLVYLGTPAPLAWHLDTSASRTGLSIQAMLYAGLVFALDRACGVANAVPDTTRVSSQKG